MNARFMASASDRPVHPFRLVCSSAGSHYGIDFAAVSRRKSSRHNLPIWHNCARKLGALGLGEVALQSAGSPNDVLIRVQRQDGGEEAQTAAVNKMRQAVTELDPGVKIERTEVVGPKVSGELARSGFIAVVLFYRYAHLSVVAFRVVLRDGSDHHPGSRLPRRWSAFSRCSSSDQPDRHRSASDRHRLLGKRQRSVYDCMRENMRFINRNHCAKSST